MQEEEEVEINLDVMKVKWLNRPEEPLHYTNSIFKIITVWGSGCWTNRCLVRNVIKFYLIL